MRSGLSAITGILITTISIVSCAKKTGTYDKIDILTLPSLTVRNDTTVYTDSGKIQLVLISPLVESFEKAEIPYTEFKSGIKVLFHNGHKEPVASVRSKYAKYDENKKLWELHDSVVAINEAGEKLETELLFWDQNKELIYTDRFVKITTEDQILQGYGLESDPRLSRRKIKNISATIWVNEDQKNGASK